MEPGSEFRKVGSSWRDPKVMKEFGCPADQHDLTMKTFVSPEMLSKPVPHTLGGKEQFSMTVPFLGRFHREQATSYL